jgi:hypothetical protein
VNKHLVTATPASNTTKDSLSGNRSRAGRSHIGLPTSAGPGPRRPERTVWSIALADDQFEPAAGEIVQSGVVLERADRTTWLAGNGSRCRMVTLVVHASSGVVSTAADDAAVRPMSATCSATAWLAPILMALSRASCLA